MAATYYPNEDTNLNIARGLVKGTKHIHKFGAVPAMSQSQFGINKNRFSLNTNVSAIRLLADSLYMFLDKPKGKLQW